MEKNKIVLITGAGFSVPAKIPLQEGIIGKLLFKKSEDFLSIESIPNYSVNFLIGFIEVTLYLLKIHLGSMIIADEEEYRKRVILLKNDNKLYIELLRYKEIFRQELEDKIIQGEHISLEDLFTTFDKALEGRNKFNGIDYEMLNKIKTNLTLLFIYYFNEDANLHNYDKEDYLNTINFVKNCDSEISIITTNWDCIFEQYLKLSEFNINYGLNNSYYSFFNKNLPSNKKENEINYIKIHGSLDWFTCISCDSLIIFNEIENSDYVFDDQFMRQCNLCDNKTNDPNMLSQLEPNIITPTMKKSLSSQLFSNLWKAAFDELAKAKKIIFIGYSLPISDFEFRYLLRRSISKEAEIDVVLWTTDNPENIPKEVEYLKNLLPEQRYKDLFSVNKPKFFYDGFSKYFLTE